MTSKIARNTSVNFCGPEAHVSSHEGYLKDVFPNMRYSWWASVGSERKVRHSGSPKLVGLAPGQFPGQYLARTRPVQASKTSLCLPDLSKISVKEKVIAATEVHWTHNLPHESCIQGLHLLSETFYALQEMLAETRSILKGIVFARGGSQRSQAR